MREHDEVITPPAVRLRRALRRGGALAALGATTLTIVWVAVLALSPQVPAGAAASERLAWLAVHAEWHLAGFAIVVPLALLYVPMWLGLAAVLWDRAPAAGVLGVAFGLLYAPVGLLGYWLQLTVVRGLVQLRASDPEEALAVVRVLHFDGAPWSLGYALAVLGYALWGLAAVAVAAGLLRLPNALAHWTGIFFALAGLLSVVGAIGFVAGAAALEQGVLLSGVASVLASAGTALLLHRADDPAPGRHGRARI